MAGLVDTHAHLDFPDYKEDFSGVLQRAREKRVKGIITIGISVESSQEAAAIAGKHSWIWSSAGIHPHDVKKVSDDYIQKLENLFRSPRILAVGETGLDYFKDRSPRETQQEVFREHIRLARRINRPLIIHCRDAYRDALKIMKEEKASETGGIMHCFSGDTEFAWEVLNMGFYISFAGPVTYPKSARLKEVVKMVPEESLLLETDAPFLSPQQYRGKRNEPSFITHTYYTVAEIREVYLQQLEEACLQNVYNLFGIEPAKVSPEF